MMTNPAPSIQSDSLSTTEVTGALDAILNTDKFQASPQMSAFLKYVVEQTLIGNTRRIKAFTVGIEALGKPASFDPQTDPSVRVLAKRLRSSLDTYYAHNLETDVFIEMKPGSYVPKFLRRCDMPAEMESHNAPSFVTSRISGTPTDTKSVSAATAGDAQDSTRTQLEQPRDSYQQPMNPTTGHREGAHISVQQQKTAAGDQASEKPADAASDNSDDKSDRKNNISQLWQNYKSPSKVA